MQAEQIAKQLGNARRANGQWVASCPVPSHGKGNGDKNPSLSISINDDGKPLFHCHGGCSQEEVFNTIKDMQLLPELEERPDPLANIKPLPQVQFDHEWEYQDENKTTVFVKQRLRIGESGKTYRLYKVDADGRRHTTLGDARIVPYNLPELLDAKSAGRIIYLVEGEKAADALATLKVTATTAHTGAGSWPEAITEYFAGANVVILPDNDLPGWRYAQKAVDAIFAIAKNVKVVDLGLQGQGDDAYEFIHEQAKTREDLIELVKATHKLTSTDVTIPERLVALKLDAPIDATPQQQLAQPEDIAKEFAPDATTPTEAKPTKPIKTVNIESWDDIQDEPVEWLIEGVLPAGGFSALYGPPGSFKSFHALHIAHCIATGTPWMGRQVVQPGAVLYIAGEGFGGIGARIKALKTHYNTPKGAPIYVIRHQLNLRSSVEDFNALMLAIERLVMESGVQFKQIIIDTLARAFGGGDENSASDMMQFVVACGRIQEIVQGAGLLILHHSGKNQALGMRGSSALLGAVDSELELMRFEDTMKGIVRIAKQKDGEDGVRYGFEMVEIEISGSSLGFDPVVSLAVQASDEAANQASKKSKNNAGKGRNQSIEMESLRSVVKQKGIQKIIEGKLRTAVNLADWRSEFRSKKGITDDSTTLEKKAFDKAWSRAQERLQDAGEVGIRDKLAWLEIKDDSEDEY